MKVVQNPWRASENECCPPPSVTGLGQGLKTCISQYPGGWSYWPQDCTGNHLLGFLVLSEAPGGLLSSTHTQASAQAQRRVSRAGAQASASLLGDGPLHVPEAAKARPPAQHEGESPGHALPSSLPHDPIQAGAWGGLCLLLTLSFPSVPLTTSLPLFLFPSFLSPARWPRSLTLIPGPFLWHHVLWWGSDPKLEFSCWRWGKKQHMPSGRAAWGRGTPAWVTSDRTLGSLPSAPGPGTLPPLHTEGWQGLWPGAGYGGSWIPWSPPLCSVTSAFPTPGNLPAPAWPGSTCAHPDRGQVKESRTEGRGSCWTAWPTKNHMHNKSTFWYKVGCFQFYAYISKSWESNWVK